MTLLMGCLALLVLGILLLGLFRDLLYAALSLALASIMLSVVLFQFGANVAAVFELSVCAGLITVLFVSTVSLTKDSDQNVESNLPRVFLVPMAVLLVGVAYFGAHWIVSLLPVAGPAAADAPGNFAQAFWNNRSTDILGQIALILVGVFGMLAMLREKRKDGKHHG